VHEGAREEKAAAESNEVPPHIDFLSPLNPNAPVHLCCFSPCVEQVQRTLTTLRELGWVDIEMVTVAQKRLEIRRERCGLQEAAQRGVQVAAATVDEALDKLREVEGRFKQAQRHAIATAKAAAATAASTAAANGCGDSEPHTPLSSTTTTQQQLKAADEKQPCMGPRKLYKEGRLVHRVEPEIKSHTSYLVFALLPRLWTPEDDERAAREWPLDATNSSEES
jgi:tRNA (adenine57-N1/adenine58-N1)-methyltransferase